MAEKAVTMTIEKAMQLQIERIAELEAQLAEAAEDKARLDWCEKQIGDDWTHWLVKVDSECLSVAHCLKGYSEPHFTTLRAAIDSARGANAQPPT